MGWCQQYNRQYYYRYRRINGRRVRQYIGTGPIGELAAAAASPEIGRRLKESLPEIILVQGIIDCCFRDEHGFVVIDFKTDHVRPSDYRNDFHRFREHYRRQLDFYREAIEKEYGESVREMYLYLLDAGRVVNMS